MFIIFLLDNDDDTNNDAPFSPVLETFLLDDLTHVLFVWWNQQHMHAYSVDTNVYVKTVVQNKLIYVHSIKEN